MMDKIRYNRYYHYAIALLFFIIVYYVAIDKTISLVFECNKMEEMSNHYYSSDKLDSLKQVENNLNKVYSKVIIDSNQNKSNIIHSISEYIRKNRISIVDISEEKVFDNGQFIIETNKLVIQGEYFTLLNLLNYLERNDTNGKVASAKLEKIVDYKTNKEYIHLTVYLQSISLS